MGRVLLERTKKYLFIPYEEGTVDQKIQIRDKSKKEFSFYYPIASSHVSGWGRIELPIEMVGETVEIITERDAMIEAIYTREQCYGFALRSCQAGSSARLCCSMGSVFKSNNST